MTDTTMHLISAGAAKGLVEARREAFERAAGMRLEGQFGAVGAMRELLDGGAPCDVLILTQAMQDELAQRGVVDAATIRPLGRVYTGVAVPAESVRPAIGDAEALGAALLAASAIYFPDPQRATAGIHFANTLVQLGVRERVAGRLHAYPNGATAMRAMADAVDPHAIGCTQVTEILYTPGVALVGRLPKAFELSTVYAAGACTRCGHADAAQHLVEMLTGAAAAAVRKAGGFESV